MALKQWTDRLLGRGDAAVTTPILDGALKPNQVLESAPIAATFDAATDITSDGVDLWVANGASVLRIDASGQQHELHRADAAITAIAALGAAGSGRLAIAVGGREIQVLEGSRVTQVLREADGRALRSVNALADGGEGRLLATEGSAEHGVDQWQRDLLCHGRSGRVLAFDLSGGEHNTRGRTLMANLQWPSGIQADGAGYRFTESWRHRLVSVADGSARTVLDNFPGYPSRMAPAAGGGAWLSVFACRSQLVEFVLREPTLRRRMVAEIDPRYWIAPAFASGQSFLEPLQGGGVKQMGMIKPWAPPRSYGLVVRLDEAGRPRYSLHSRVGGTNHGVVAAAECHGALYVLARGPGRLLRLSLDAIREEFE